MRSTPNALPGQIANLKTWHTNHHNAILGEEIAYIDQDEDLTTIVPISKTPLRRYLERMEWFQTSSWFRRLPTQPSLVDDETLYYHSDESVQAFDSGLVMLIGLVMLLAPIWILNAVKGTSDRLRVITVFVTAFLLLLQVVTIAKPSETLAATAACVLIL